MFLVGCAPLPYKTNRNPKFQPRPTYSVTRIVSHCLENLSSCQFSVYKNCAEVYQSGDRNSGVHKIDPDGLGEFEVFCDQTTDGGGWTVFQKRMDGSVDFFRGWDEYKQGFGNQQGFGQQVQAEFGKLFR